MALYLKHYFDPDMTHLQPKLGCNNKTDLYNLGYVQNVEKDQLLAEFVPLSSVKTIDKRFVYSQDTLPVGPNTYIDAENPHRLLAADAGYVFYNAEKIMVKTTLTLQSDVSFQTGNIVFIGDTIINGNVRAGFSVYGENIVINGMVEGGSAIAKNDLAVKAGARGAGTKLCILKASNTVRLSFAEKIEVYTRGNVLATKYILHSNVYAGINAVIQEHMIGGNLHALKAVYVGKQLGNRAYVPTRIFLGYDPLLIRRLEKIDLRISDLAEQLHHLNAVAGHLPPESNELARKLARVRRKNSAYLSARNAIWENLNEASELLRACRVVAIGDIYPGVEIAIGRSYLQVDKPLKCVEFFLNEDNEIAYIPHIPKK